MKPRNWPKSFTYSPVSSCGDVHPSIFRQWLATGNPQDEHVISPCIEEARVHPHIRIKKITPGLRYKGVSPHPLCNSEVFSGHVQHGVFATKKIAKGVQLGEYVGEVLLSEESCKSSGGAGGLYCWRFSINEICVNIYSRNLANELVFVNDFRGLQPHPNVSGKFIIHRGSYYFGYETLRDIEPQEELLIDYGQVWAKHLFKEI